MMPRPRRLRAAARPARRSAELATLPVILLSARAGEEARVEGLEAGADDYLVKPFSARELLARIASALQLARARRQAAERERALYRTDERFRVALQNAPIVVYSCDRDLRYTWIANPVGFAAADLIGKRDQDLPPFGGMRELVAFKRGVLDSGKPERRVLDFVLGGTPMTFEMAAEPLFGAHGQIEGLTVAGIDLTRQTRDAAALRRLNETLETRVREAVAAREAAQAQLAQAQRMEALGQLAGGIAHDFNNVLQAVLGGLSLIGRRADNAEAVRQVARHGGGCGEPRGGDHRPTAGLRPPRRAAGRAGAHLRVVRRPARHAGAYAGRRHRGAPGSAATRDHPVCWPIAASWRRCW